MPIKWTADKDQLLLTLILKVHNFRVEADKIAKEWPDDKGERPTGRAITERLVKIRKQVGATGNMAIASTQNRGTGTPRKTQATPRKTVGTPKTPASKKRRVVETDSEDDEDTPARKTKIGTRLGKTPTRGTNGVNGVNTVNGFHGIDTMDLTDPFDLGPDFAPGGIFDTTTSFASSSNTNGLGSFSVAGPSMAMSPVSAMNGVADMNLLSQGSGMEVTSDYSSPTHHASVRRTPSGRVATGKPDYVKMENGQSFDDEDDEDVDAAVRGADMDDSGSDYEEEEIGI